MVQQELIDLKIKLERVVRETISSDVLESVFVSISPDHDGDTAIYINLDLCTGLSGEEYADIARNLGQKLVEYTHTSDGFLFPYIRMRTERGAA